MAVAVGSGQRSTRLSMLALIVEGILEPGVGLLTFDYMGKRCRADLLPDGMIQWNGSKYSSPYAWASQCKNQVNPDHKSGIGWGHIRYKGIKLSQYKSMYIKKHQLGSSDIIDSFGQGDESPEPKPPVRRGKRRNFHLPQDEHFTYQSTGYIKSENLRDQIYSAGSFDTVAVTQKKIPSDQATLLPTQSTTECIAQSTKSATETFEYGSFESLGIEQPFSVTVTSNTLMIMDFHSHISTEEVMGYLGGLVDDNTHTIEVTEAFPCKFSVNRGEDIEKEIRIAMKQKGLIVVGWYHSHPNCEAKPTESDIICQKSYQEAVQRDDGDELCIAVITGPNHSGNLQNVTTELQFFYTSVVKHEEVKVSPIILEYSVVWEKYLTQEVVNELNSLVTFYKEYTTFPKFSSIWRADTSFKDKFKESLKHVQPKFPEESSDETFMNYIDQLIDFENCKKLLQ